MAGQYKISVRKVLQALLTLVVTLGCVVAMVSASRVQGDERIKKVEVQIVSGKRYHFVEEKQIMKEAVENRGIDVLHTPLKQLDLMGMEQALNKDPWIEQSQVFVDNNRVLHITVTQRIPVARLFTANGESCYMDKSLHIMPLTPNFIFYTLVVTNVPQLGTDSLGMSIKYRLRTLVNAIQADSFWSAQVSEIALDSNANFELIPLAGDHTIVFGDTARIKEKFSNLYTFYLNVLNKIGWDRYTKLDVRFKGQVIASPALPYNGPVDKVSKSWIVGMLETENRKDSLLNALEPRQGSALPAKVNEGHPTSRQPTTDKKGTSKEPKKDGTHLPATISLHPLNSKGSAKKPPEQHPVKKEAKKEEKGSSKGAKDTHKTKDTHQEKDAHKAKDNRSQPTKVGDKQHKEAVKGKTPVQEKKTDKNNNNHNK